MSKRPSARDDMYQRSLDQWMLIRALAFGERDYIVVSTLVFLLSPQYVFLSLAGFTIFVIGLFTTAPIYGVGIYFTQRIVYRQRIKRGHPPRSIADIRRMTWIVNIFWFPVMAWLNWWGFGLWHSLWNSLMPS